MFYTRRITCSLYCIFLFSGTLYAQSTLDEDRKKNLLDQIKPELPLIDSKLKKEESELFRNEQLKIVNKQNIKEKVERYRSGGAQFEKTLSIKELKASMLMMDLFKLENGNSYKILLSRGKSYLIKKTQMDFIQDQLSQKNRLQGVKVEATAGGLNLSGFKEKKGLSSKTKSVLIHVLGADVEE